MIWQNMKVQSRGERWARADRGNVGHFYRDNGIGTSVAGKPGGFQAMQDFFGSLAGIVRAAHFGQCLAHGLNAEHVDTKPALIMRDDKRRLAVAACTRANGKPDVPRA